MLNARRLRNRLGRGCVPLALCLLAFMSTEFTLAQEEVEDGEKFEVIPIPLLELSAPTNQILVGETLQFRLMGTFPNGIVQDLTASSTGTAYQSSSVSIASVGPEGGVSAVAPGTVTVSASNDGFVASMRLKVIDPNDRDGDLLPDSYEAANGLDPTDPVDGLLDTDSDFLNNRAEFQLGTNPQSADTDGDGLRDGEEVLSLGLDPLVFSPQVDDTCVAAVLNRSVRADPSGAIVIPNVPGTGGVERISVTCEREGMTLAGQSAFFRVVPGAVLDLPSITLGVVEPIPETLEVTTAETVLTTIGATTQLTVTGHFADGSFRDLTSEDRGTTYVSSNPGIAAVGSTPSGLVRAVGSGTALIAIRNQGVLTVVSIQVELGLDADQDGLSDDFEASRPCLDASVVDANADPDGDGLTNIAEFDGTGVPGFSGGTEPCVADTDGDGLTDSAEAGSASSPVLADTDVDGLIDSAEPAGDFDGDGLANVRDSDSDNDGLPDGLEVRICGTPFCANALADDDGDGLRNIDEVALFTDLLSADSDSDGLTDGEEAVRGTDPLVSDRTPPTVTLAAPAPGTDLVEGERLIVRADAADDGRVTGVEFRVAGNLIATATAAPFETTIVVPIDITSLTLEAAATDTNNNSATTGSLTFPVVEDALTAVRGTTVDEAGSPVEAAVARVRLPLVPVETGDATVSGSVLTPESGTSLRSSALSGSIAFDAGTRPLLGEAVDLATAGPVTLSGSLTLDFGDFSPFLPTHRNGMLSLSGTSPTGLNLALEGVLESFPVVAGSFAFAADLSVTAFDPAGIALAEPLAGRQSMVHLQGVVQVQADPSTSEVSSLAITVELEQSVRLELTGTSDVEGAFSIPDVPTIFGDIVVDADKRDAGGFLRRGSSAATLFVRGGFTDVGDITLHLLPRARRDYPVGGVNPLSMAVADLNGDGALDVVTGNASSNDVSVLLGKGDGTLHAPRRFGGFSARPRGLTVGDFDEDGSPDVATANENSLNVSILLGDGQGNLAFLENHPIVVSRPFAVASGDLNRDGHLDLAVVPSGDAVAVLLGHGNGAFDPPFTVPVVGGAGSLAVAIDDFNADGNPDLVTANTNRDNVSVVLGNGNGTFQSSQQFAVGRNPLFVAVGDLNGDGAKDLVVPNEQDHNVSVLLGNGNGTFQVACNFGTGTFPLAVGIGDLHADGVKDLVVSSPGADSLTLLRGVGDGTFQNIGTPRTGQDPSVPVVVDLNGDSKQDIVLSDGGTDSVSVFIGRGDGTLETSRALATQDQPTAVDVGDVNDDGAPDLVLSQGAAGGGSVEVLLGAGDGSFPTRRLSSVRSGVDIELGDLDGDGLLDLALAEFIGPTGFVWAPLGNGDGTFTVFQQSVLSMGNRTGSLRIADLNADGTPDIVATNRDSNNVSVRLGLCTAFGFQPAVHYAVGSQPLSVDVADLNGDGSLDLAVANFGSSSVSVLRGNGDGTFAPAQSFASGSAPFSLGAGDFDRDGVPDLAVTSDTARTVSILLGAGDGTLGAPQAFTVNRNPRSVMTEDLNGDGLLDLVMVNTFANNVAVLLGRGDGTFRPASFYGVQLEPSSVAVGDVNNDGAPDLIVTNPPTDEVSILFGRGDGTF